jgi:hypothetical protein
VDTAHSSFLPRVLLSFPPDGLEDELLRLFDDPERRSGKFPDGFRLAARRPTPRLRAALFRSLWNPQPIWAYHRPGALRALAGMVGKDDLPEIARLRADADSVRREGGLLLAARAGDETAAKELAASLAAIGPHPLARRPQELLPLLDAATAGMKDAWTARPTWKEGALWLARRGDPEALEHLGRNRDLPGALAALAARGDDAALAALVARADPGGRWTPDEELAFLAAAKPEHWKPIVALARKRNHPPSDPAFRAAALAARPEALDLFRQQAAKPIPPTPASEVYNRVRSLSATALGRLGDRDSLFLLRPLLRSPNPLDRAAAAGALAELGDRDSVARLVRLVDDPDELRLPDERLGADVPIRRVWHAAMEALERLTGLKTEGASVVERRAFWRSRAEAK